METIACTAGRAELLAACQRWLDAPEYPPAVLLLGVESGDAPEAALAVADLPFPVIGHADGAVCDGALELWLACDVRVAGANATFGVSPGYVPRAGLTHRLPRIVGRAAALDLLLVRDRVDAGEALRTGLASRLGGEQEARALLDRLAKAPPIAARFAKEAVLRGEALTLEQGLRLETDLYALLQTTADRAEGLAAWRERRTPRFRGE